MSEKLQEQVDKATEKSHSLEIFGTLWLDALSQKECQDWLNINQRTKLSYEVFDGGSSGFSTFIKNAEQIFSFFQTSPNSNLFNCQKSPAHK